jgi:hypothetical protein
MNTETTLTSGHERAGPRLPNPGAQLLGFLGANMTVGALAVLIVPVLVEPRAGASWGSVAVMCLAALAFIGGLLLMTLAVRRIRSSGR